MIAQQCHVVHRGVYLGSANVQTQYFSSDLQRLCMEDLSYHPKTCLKEKNKKTDRLPCNARKLTENRPKTADRERFLPHMLHSSMKISGEYKARLGVLPC